ncbi:hypothetical protein D3C76_879190 [compost metagenome]
MQVFDDLADFFHRVLGALGKVAHFVGHYGKTTPGFTGARRLDGGIECQQVGLPGDGTDHFQYRTDLLAAVGQPLKAMHGVAHVLGQGVDGRGGLGNHAQALLAGLVGIARRVSGLGGAVG